MQARRIFGATSPIRLAVRSGDSWMGEEITASESVPLSIEAEGTAPIDTGEVFVDGKAEETLRSGGQVAAALTAALNIPAGRHSVYVRISQLDGERA
jgi:hypothetical protein